jgi:predicted lipoprotein with Yx(FWY)xxD motif
MTGTNPNFTKTSGVNMQRLRRIRYRIGAVVALIGVSVLVAACGSSASTTTATTGSGAAGSTASASSSATAAPAAAKGTAISTTKGSDGTFLTGAGGRALYLWVADAKGMSSCSGACAQAWPPLTTTSKPVAAGSVKASQLGTIKRSDGTEQVTYNGHPLYYFNGDPSSGTTNGQGSDAFGAKWWLVSPAGAAITSTGAAASTGAGASSSTSTSSSGGGSSSWS